MMSKQARKGLGRGLSALMADVEPIVSNSTNEPAPRGERMIAIDRVLPNPNQPRRRFDEEALAELSRSIAEKGIIQPLILRPHPSQTGAYEIVAGERRWRAAQRAKLHEVPAIVRTFDDTEVLEVAIIENIQRADLNPIEEARGYKNLIDSFGHTQERVAEALGKSRSHIANLMRLLNLPEEILGLVEEAKLSAGHARALLTANDPMGLAREIMAKGLSVRETERRAKTTSSPAREIDRNRPDKDADTRRLEADLTATLKMRVQINHGSDGRGSVTVAYRDLDQLDEICRLLSRTELVD